MLEHEKNEQVMENNDDSGTSYLIINAWQVAKGHLYSYLLRTNGKGISVWTTHAGKSCR